MSFFLGETREREGQTFATGEEFRGVVQTLGDGFRRTVAEAQRAGEGYSDAQLDAINAGQSRLFSAARRSFELVDSSAGRANAIADAFDNRIETVRRVTGVTLENPERNAYYKEAEDEYRLLRQQGTISAVDAVNGDSFASRRVELQRQVFNRKVDELAQAQPDKASALAFGQSIEDQARAIAGAAAAELDNARRETGGGFVPELAGSLAGIGRDPGNLAGLFAGGGLGTAKTIMGRLAQVLLREGAINAGIEALQQPGVQAWRGELGLKHGIEPAIENIGMAFLFGAAIGGGVQGLGEVFGRGVSRASDQDRAAVQAVLRGEASADEVERAARAMGVQLDETAQADLANLRRIEADDATVPAAPQGVSVADHNDALLDAMRAAENPDAAPPAVEPLRASRLDERIVQERPELAAYADDPPQTVLGLAAVREDVWRAVQAGEIDAVHASWIGRMAADAPDSHGGLLLALRDAAPQTVAEARLVIRDAQAAALRREAQDAILGAIGQETDALARRLDPALFQAIDTIEARVDALRAELGRVLATDPASGAALAPRIAALEAELGGITGKRKSSPRAAALRDEIARLQADRDMLQRQAALQLREQETALRLGLSEAEMDRARLGPQLRAAREAAAARESLSPEIAALRERLAALDEAPPRQPPARPPLRPAETIEPGTPEAVRQTDALLPDRQAPTDSVLPPVPDGMVRMWHGGISQDLGMPKWFSSDRRYAEGYSTDGTVGYVDLPLNHPLLARFNVDEFTNIKNGMTANLELPAAIADLRRVAPKANAPEPALSDMIPVAGRTDGRDMRAMTVRDALREAERPSTHGDLIASCKL